MALDFPTSPALNDIYTFGGRSWQWNGYAWDVYSTTTGTVVNTLNGLSGGVTLAAGTNITLTPLGNTITIASSGGGGGGGTYFSFTEGNTVTSGPTAGDRWFDTDTGKLFTAITDGASRIWVDLSGAGPQGNTGATGNNGTNGATGATGANGTNGNTGATGANGTNGTNGNTGATGTNGTNGNTGATGPQGNTGATGNNGTNGTNGATGATGSQGNTGATGNNGTNGTNGATGATGPQGNTGNNGTNGTNGATGATGSQGNTGATGNNGTNGATGATGPQGNTGATGPVGNYVSTLNGLTGGVTLAAGTNITLTPVGNTITIASSGGGGGGSSVYGVTASLDFSANNNGLEIVIYSTGLDYFTSLKYIENDVNALYINNGPGTDYTTVIVNIKSFYDATNGWSARIIVKPIFDERLSPGNPVTAEQLYDSGINAIRINLKSSTLDETWDTVVSSTLYHQEETYVTKTLTGITWVTDSMFLNCKVLGLTSPDHTPEDALLEGVNFEINNILGGTGFDIIGHAPEGTYGKYTIKCLGQ